VSLLLSKGLEDRSKSRVNGRRGSRDSTTGTPSIIIIIRDCCALSLELVKSGILGLSVNH
jgi:hypothetical protein